MSGILKIVYAIGLVLIGYTLFLDIQAGYSIIQLALPVSVAALLLERLNIF